MGSYNQNGKSRLSHLIRHPLAIDFLDSRIYKCSRA